MFKPVIALITSLLILSQLIAFCGFYVAKSDLKLFNETSQVIIARHKGETVITMQSDFQGDLKDFAMVVPVPVVLKKKQIRLVNPDIFEKLDQYSGPRLVEYHDDNPCNPQVQYYLNASRSTAGIVAMESAVGGASRDKYKVKVEEKYTVGGYDILVLSAEESGGLEAWLIDNDYKIPEGAAEVLEPYIKENLKFFVVKVNLDEYKKQKKQSLEPIQMRFASEKFGLPIRLGMANANGDQDMIVYAFAQNGRVELTNYRNVEIPTDRNIPNYLKENFGNFYHDLFVRSWEEMGKNVSFLEYAWDLSSSNYVKCDPCPTAPPAYADLEKAGVFWVDAGYYGSTADYNGNVFMTRMHVRYNRETFPQDLKFQLTPNKERFQGRYIMRHPAEGDLSCDAANDYLKQLVKRRKMELEELAVLTGWDPETFPMTYVSEYENMIVEEDKNHFWIIPGDFVWPALLLSLLFCGAAILLIRRHTLGRKILLLS